MECEICEGEIPASKQKGVRTCSDRCARELRKRVRLERPWRSGPKPGFQPRVKAWSLINNR